MDDNEICLKTVDKDFCISTIYPFIFGINPEFNILNIGFVASESSARLYFKAITGEVQEVKIKNPETALVNFRDSGSYVNLRSIREAFNPKGASQLVLIDWQDWLATRFSGISNTFLTAVNHEWYDLSVLDSNEDECRIINRFYLNEDVSFYLAS